MTRIIWDDFGSRTYEAGVDRCVFYPIDGIGIPWNGIVSISESIVGNEKTDLYFDGVKYGESYPMSEFSGTIRAYTYPYQFMEYEGIEEIGGGLYIANQQQKKFNLVYRTKSGDEYNNISSGESNYKIHILYNLTATPSTKTYQSLSNGTEAIIFEWEVSSVPAEVPGYHPSAHLILDTRYMEPNLIEDIESVIYGDNVNEPKLPKAATLAGFVNVWVVIRITDEGDGTFTIEGPDDLVVDNLDETFDIIRANIVGLDGVSYYISNTTY